MQLRDALTPLNQPARRFPQPVKRYSGAGLCSRIEKALRWKQLWPDMGQWASCAGQRVPVIERFSSMFRWAILSCTSSEYNYESLRGGHDIPDADIRRRYLRSLTQAPEALSLADEAVVLDNSGLHPVRMLLLKGGRVVWRAETLPEWVQRLSARLG